MENKEPISKTLLAFNALLALSILAMIFVIYGILHKPPKTEVEHGQLVMTHAFDNLSFEAKSIYIFDVIKDKVVYEKNENTQLPLASLTKLMMALTATELLPKDSRITIKKEFLREEGDTGLLADESWKLKDLLDFSLMVSSNDGARSIASVIGAFDLKTNDYNLGRKDFIEKMNTQAQELGLLQTYFINESGLDEEGVSGGYGSAKDISKLMQYILINRPELLEATKYETATINSLNKISHTAKNTNDDVNQIPGLIASKTGYTALAGGNITLAFDASIGRPIIVVILGSSEKGRFKDATALVKASLEYAKE